MFLKKTIFEHTIGCIRMHLRGFFRQLKITATGMIFFWGPSACGSELGNVMNELIPKFPEEKTFSKLIVLIKRDMA